ncbi:MAG: hypothetical protein II075_11440 [Bacteroidales bacterium]|nr:hypothetical protein [Bacteroidales bacterium]
MGNSTYNEIIDAMWGDFDTRVWKICDFYGIKKNELAEKLGIQQQRMSRLKVGKHHQEAYQLLLAFPNINPRWLLFGQEPMIAPAPIVAGSPQDSPEDRASKLADITRHETQQSPEYNCLLDKYTALAIENALLKQKLSDIATKISS